MSTTRRRWWIYLLLTMAVWPAVAKARPVRRVFEPMDLDFETPGVFEQDYAIGMIRGDDSYRLSLPDFEFTLGLSENVEIDLDGESAVTGPDQDTVGFNRYSPDNLWPSVKFGLLDYGDGDDDSAFAVGIQVGPKFPVARKAQGVGIEGMLLIGGRYQKAHLVLNLGGLRDPGGGGDSPRPSGPELGFDFGYPLDADAQWSFDAGLGAVLYTSPDPYQATLLAGISWSPNDDLTLSVSGLYGLLSGGDQYGVLLGIVPSIHLW